LLFLGSLLSFSQNGRSAHLVAQQTGWFAARTHLYWTQDGGNKWQDITPKVTTGEVIVDVFFLDPSNGWALLAGANTGGIQPTFDLASTTNSGATWAVTKVQLPKFDSGSLTLSGAGSVTFLDSLHGWMNLDVNSSANFRLGTLLVSNDGGKTWSSAINSPGESGTIRFITLKDGWLAGGPGGQHLYVTHDGSNSWQQVNLKAPSGLDPTGDAVYDLPTFLDSSNGFLPVSYESSSLPGVALFAAEDGGRNWTVRATVPKAEDTHVNTPVPSGIAGSALILADVSNGGIKLTTISLNSKPAFVTGKVVRPHPLSLKQDDTVLEVSFENASYGWVLTSGELLATSDAGLSWQAITPVEEQPMLPIQKKPKTRSDATFRDSSSSSAPLALGVGNSMHMGFHLCGAMGMTNMQKWWSASPFVDSGVYIGGASRTCPNSNLNLSWVSQITAQGWGIMPLWAGPQAPCACRTYPPCTPFPHVFSSTPSTAQADGVAEANAAATIAAGMGLSGTVIYYDMEQYQSGCGSAVRAFVNGWVSQLHSNGYLAGVYGAPAGAQTDWWNVSPRPDAVGWRRLLAEALPQMSAFGI
jgi:photosystem II stability/assembly factor-like uncharacterized protein